MSVASFKFVAGDPSMDDEYRLLINGNPTNTAIQVSGGRYTVHIHDPIKHTITFGKEYLSLTSAKAEVQRLWSAFYTF
jgi:hypothetical protein